MADKDKIKDEIEGLRKHYIERDDYDNGYNKALDDIIHVIDSMQDENTPFYNDRESASRAHALERFRTTRNYDIAERCRHSFNAGVEWHVRYIKAREKVAMHYLEENHSPSEMSDFQAAMNIAVAKAYNAGMENQMYLLKQDSFNSEVVRVGDTTATTVVWPHSPEMTPFLKRKGLHNGDKVRIIIVKEN